jgi:radical SAM superfamily enzyme YgiQ (UPF0313 family)
MELTSRRGSDRFVPPGGYRALAERLRRRSEQWREVRTAVLSCFDLSTRIMPFWLYDSWMFPAGARSVAGALHDAGFERTRAVFQLWNRRFRPSAARLDGRPLDMLLLSTMQIHSAQASRAIRDAWTLGDDRPLIIIGGPHAWYDPYNFWPMTSADGSHGIGPDVVVTGEQYVLLDLLDVLAEFTRPGEGMRATFERARRSGALAGVPGLVYLAPGSTFDAPVLTDTGLQRLVQCFDEYPEETVALGLLEPPHRGSGLAKAALPARKVRRYSPGLSVVFTQGCKFNCPYCPIPALNQRSWRYRSPERSARELRTLHERFGLRFYFGADDNFFNHRQTAEETFDAIARQSLFGRPLGSQIVWGTEATQFDVSKNRDLLPLGARAGLHAIWFGIEDLTAELINKGQKPEVTTELFRLMYRLQIAPMAMMMYHEGQPAYSPRGIYGLRNQVAFLRKAGAATVQITNHNPAHGSREMEKTYATGRVASALGDYPIPLAKLDGNHVYVAGREKLWKRQLNLLLGYLAFYNPLNILRSLRPDCPSVWVWLMRLLFQIGGFVGVLVTIVKMLPYLWRLKKAEPRFYPRAPAITRVPVVLAAGSFSRLPADPPLKPENWDLIRASAPAADVPDRKAVSG